MKEYKKPEIHFVRNPGELKSSEVANMSNEELTTYLENCGYRRAKKLYQINPNFLLRKIADEYAIIPVNEEAFAGNAIMTPNRTAAFLWQKFERPSTEEDVVLQALQQFDGSEEEIRAAVRRFIMDSLNEQVLKEVNKND